MATLLVHVPVGGKGKINCAGVHKGFPGDRVCPYRMTTQLCRYLFLIWKYVFVRLFHLQSTPLTIFFKNVVRTM